MQGKNVLHLWVGIAFWALPVKNATSYQAQKQHQGPNGHTKTYAYIIERASHLKEPFGFGICIGIREIRNLLHLSTIS